MDSDRTKCKDELIKRLTELGADDRTLELLDELETFAYEDGYNEGCYELAPINC